MLKWRNRYAYKINGRPTSRERDTMLGKFRFAHMYSIYISIESEHLLLQKTALTSSPSLSLSSFFFAALTHIPVCKCVFFPTKRKRKKKKLPGVVFLLCSVAGQRARVFSPVCPRLCFFCFYFGDFGERKWEAPG